MKTFLLILGNLWMLPNTLIGASYLAIFWAAGWIELNFLSLSEIDLQIKKDCWLYKRMGDSWFGWSSGIFSILKEDRSIRRNIYHEQRHIQQQMLFGPLFLLLYLLAGLYAMYKNKSFYSDNVFEKDAKHYSLQKYMRSCNNMFKRR